MINFPDINTAALSLLINTINILNKNIVKYIIVGGW
jgi:hypothetical protein